MQMQNRELRRQYYADGFSASNTIMNNPQPDTPYLYPETGTSSQTPFMASVFLYRWTHHVYM